MTFQLINKEDLVGIMQETVAVNSDIDIEEELPAWGIEPEAFYDMADSFVTRSVDGLRVTGDPYKVIGSLFYLGFTLGVKVALEAEMRRMAESPRSGD